MAAPRNKKKGRQYSQEYLKFGFVPSFTNETMPMCLLCKKTFSNNAMKPAKMRDHLERINCDKKNKDLDFFKVLKEKIRNRPNLSISVNIAKKGKSYTIGEEIIIPAIKDVIENVMKKDSQTVLKCIKLSANTVQRRIDEMADDWKKTLASELQHCKFSIQLDESTFGSSNLLMVYVRYNSPSLKCIINKFLFGKYLKGDAKSETIFQCLVDYLKEHNIPIGNITAVTTDGAPAMASLYKGFAALLKQKGSQCTYYSLCFARKLSGELHDALKVCIRSINKIKAHPLNSRLFAMLCEKKDETLKQLLLHTEVRWLSRGDSLQDLYDSTVEFLTDADPSICNQLKMCKNHLFYLADLYSKFNEVQKRLQVQGVTIIQARTILMGFQVKIG